MAVARIKDLRALSKEELSKRLEAYEREMLEAGENPKKGKNLRRAIARIKTILSEREETPSGTKKVRKVA